MPKTREELKKENTRLEQSNEHYAREDKNLRAEFAKAFGWYKSDRYSNDRTPMEATWPQIFVELGRYLASHDFRHFEGNISEIEMELAKLKEHILPLEKN